MTSISKLVDFDNLIVKSFLIFFNINALESKSIILPHV